MLLLKPAVSTIGLALAIGPVTTVSVLNGLVTVIDLLTGLVTTVATGL